MEKLYNGIILPDAWPPRKPPFRAEGGRLLPDEPPYLTAPPECIDISIGRQLFVDTFLIEDTDLFFSFHRAVKYGGNPVFRPETPWEVNEEGCSCACPKSGAVLYDPGEKLYKMWYEAGWLGGIAYASSRDGISWERPLLDIVPGTNLILPRRKSAAPDRTVWEGPDYFRPDSVSVVKDPECAPGETYKMLLRNPGGLFPGIALVSPDGIHWSDPRETGEMGDRSTLFYNPFRKKWVFSIRSIWSPRKAFGLDDEKGWARVRSYREDSDFRRASQWEDMDQCKWMCADSLDMADTDPYARRTVPELYNLDAAPYESIMLGMFQIFLGPENGFCERSGTPKLTGLIPMYSRDGWHWSRPRRELLIAPERTDGSWDRGYVQSVGGICTVNGDRLRIYYSGFSGDPSKAGRAWTGNGMYSGGALGFAEIRRDGFVSLSAGDGPGSVLTRVMTFSKGKLLFVNAEKCVLSTEILNGEGTVIASSPEREVDSVSEEIPLADFDASSLRGTRFRIRFRLKKGDLYSFWFAENAEGESGGYFPSV